MLKENFNENYSHNLLSTLYLIILSICVCSLSRSSKIIATTREMSVREQLVRVCANDTLLRNVCLTILVKNQIFLNEVKWDEIRK